MPPSGLLRVQFSLPLVRRDMRVGYVTEGGLPFLDMNLSGVFRSLGIGNVLHVLSHIMLEGSVLFLSDSHSRLFEVAEGLMALLKPLEWGMVYVPVLPITMVRGETT